MNMDLGSKQQYFLFFMHELKFAQSGDGKSTKKT